jgi:hypothetical protein
MASNHVLLFMPYPPPRSWICLSGFRPDSVQAGYLEFEIAGAPPLQEVEGESRTGKTVRDFGLRKQREMDFGLNAQVLVLASLAGSGLAA